MSNVVSLNLPARRLPLSRRLPALVDGFARHRRCPEDVFWLKENAEILNLLVSTQQACPRDILSVHAPLFEDLRARLTFFPQYYRFLLSIGLDLEDLGFAQGRMEQLCAEAAQARLDEAELSDLQRAEARRLFARRGVAPMRPDPHLDQRLLAFMERPQTFAVPNKKAAYELTHIVFYLSDYGRCDPSLSDAALLGLEYAGLMAFLDQNMDLLAEVCVALRYAGRLPSPVWEAAVRQCLSGFTLRADDVAPLSDGCHTYLVAAWSAMLAGCDDTGVVAPEGRFVFEDRGTQPGALHSISHTLYAMPRTRSRDWARMRSVVYGAVTDEAAQVIDAAERSSSVFDAFFESFARASGA